MLPELAQESDAVSTEHRQWWTEYLTSHEQHFLNVISLLAECGDPDSLLDVGNFPGHFTLLTSRLGFRVAGLDLAPERAAELWTRNGIDQRQLDIETDDFPFAEQSFDVVVLTEVFEHLRVNPMRALREARRVLRPGGHFILSVPNVSPLHRVRFLLGRDYQGDIVKEFEKLERLGHMGHFRLYSRNEIERILEYAGFDVEVVRVAGEFPGGRRRFVRYLGPWRNRFRSHLYTLSQRPWGA